MAGISESVEVKGLTELLARIPGDAKRHATAVRILRRLALRVEAKAKSKAPARTGNLRRSVHSVVVDAEPAAYVQVDARYGPFVEFGTGVYGPRGQRIYPKSKQALAWPGGSTGPQGNLRLTGRTKSGAPASMIVRRSIAGMKPQPFLRPAWDEVQRTDVGIELEAAAAQIFEPGAEAS